MSNIQVDAPLVNGDLFPLHELGESCGILVETILGDDLRPPPRNLKIKITTGNGKLVEVVIPNDHTSVAVVKVDGVDL